MNDTINQVGAGAPAERLREALAGMLAIIDDSQGVAGYHLNGAIAEWDEFPEVEVARAVLAELPECGCCGRAGECGADCDARQAAPAAPEAALSSDERVAALCDLSYRAGLKAGWNYCADGDETGFARSMESAREAVAVLNERKVKRGNWGDA